MQREPLFIDRPFLQFRKSLTLSCPKCGHDNEITSVSTAVHVETAMSSQGSWWHYPRAPNFGVPLPCIITRRPEKSRQSPSFHNGCLPCRMVADLFWTPQYGWGWCSSGNSLHAWSLWFTWSFQFTRTLMCHRCNLPLPKPSASTNSS